MTDGHEWLDECEAIERRRNEESAENLAAIADLRAKLTPIAGKRDNSHVTQDPAAFAGKSDGGNSQVLDGITGKPIPGAKVIEVVLTQKSQFAALPWKDYANGSGSWIFANAKDAGPLRSKIGTAKFYHDADGLFYSYSGPKEEPRKFITRSRGQPK